MPFYFAPRRKALTHGSGEDGVATDNHAEESPFEVTKGQNAEYLTVGKPFLAANGSQPMASPTNLRNDSSIQAESSDPIWLVVAQVVLVFVWPLVTVVALPIFMTGSAIVR